MRTSTAERSGPTESVGGQESWPGNNPEKGDHSVGGSIVRGALANLSPQPFTWAASLLGAALIPRLLGSQALGQVTLAGSVAALAATVLDLGIVEYLTRRIARRPEGLRRDLTTALAVQLVTFTAGAVAIAVVAPLVAPTLLDFRLLDIVLIGIVGGCTQSILTAALRGRESHLKFAWFTAIPSILNTVGGVLFLSTGAGVVAYAACVVALNLLSTAFCWCISGLRPARLVVDPTLARRAGEFIRGGFPFLTWNVTMSFYSGVDRILLGFFVPSAQVGWYAAAYRIVGIPVFIPSMLTAPLFPVLSRSADEPQKLRRAIAQTLRITLLLTIPIAAGICVIAPVVPTLFGWPADFDRAVPLIIILSLQMPVVAIDMVLGTVVMAIGRERMWVRVGLAALALNVTANLVCIPLLENATGNGAIGAALITVLTEILMFVGAIILLPKSVLDAYTLVPTAKILVGSVLAAMGASLVLPWSLPLAAGVGALIYVIAVMLLRAVTVADARYVVGRLRRAA